MLIKLYIYGYLNGIRSSRKLEREAIRNLEVIWLMDNLHPSYKTIANFRKDNSQALQTINKNFILICRQLSLFKGDEVAIDGSFFKGNASKASIYTEKKLEQQLAELDKKVSEYQKELEEQDAIDEKKGLGSLVETENLSEKIKALKEKQAEKKALQTELKNSGRKQISTTDPDAQLLNKRGQTIAGYNVQIAVDNLHKLIVVDEVTQDGNDMQQLVPMLEKAKDLLQTENMVGLADAGYFSGEQIKQAAEKGLDIYVPIPKKEGTALQDGQFTRDQFIYDEANDCYQCPQGEALTRGGGLVKKGNRNVAIYSCKTATCQNCPLRTQCLGKNATYKRLDRWEHEKVVDNHRERMKNATGKPMKKRASLVEHPFGTLKHRAGMHHFLMRGIDKCRGEFGLMIFCYNFTRVLNILGIDKFREYCAHRLK